MAIISSSARRPSPAAGPQRPQSAHCERHIMGCVCREGPGCSAGGGGASPQGLMPWNSLPSQASQAVSFTCRPPLLWERSPGPQGCWEQKRTVNNHFGCVAITYTSKSLDFRSQEGTSASKLEPPLGASTLESALHVAFSGRPQLPGVLSQPAWFPPLSLHMCRSHLLMRPVP